MRTSRGKLPLEREEVFPLLKCVCEGGEGLLKCEPARENFLSSERKFSLSSSVCVRVGRGP
jgi:hypothetical protein